MRRIIDLDVIYPPVVLGLERDRDHILGTRIGKDMRIISVYTAMHDVRVSSKVMRSDPSSIVIWIGDSP